MTGTCANNRFALNGTHWPITRAWRSHQLSQYNSKDLQLRRELAAQSAENQRHDPLRIVGSHQFHVFFLPKSVVKCADKPALPACFNSAAISCPSLKCASEMIPSGMTFGTPHGPSSPCTYNITSTFSPPKAAGGTKTATFFAQSCADATARASAYRGHGGGSFNDRGYCSTCCVVAATRTASIAGTMHCVCYALLTTPQRRCRRNGG